MKEGQNSGHEYELKLASTNQFKASTFLGKTQASDHCPCPVSGEFESCHAGVGNLNWKYQFFSAECKYYILKYEGVFR